MYLHLGEQITIRSDDIVGIFDLENTSISKATRDLLTQAEKNGEVVNVTDKLPKSFVLCKENTGKAKCVFNNGVKRKNKSGRQRIYILQMSAATMYKRSGFIGRLAENMPEET